jgi:hypothetical protein
VPRWEPLHPEFRRALRVLAALDLCYAEAWRALIPVAVRIDRPRPSYWIVRRVLIAERRRLAERRARRDRIVADLLTGLVKRPLYEATQAP